VEAEKSLCWLSGWVNPNFVQYELSMINKSIALNEEKVRMKKNKKFYSFYVKRTFLLPYFIITASFFFGNFGGMTTLQINSVSFNYVVTHAYLYLCSVYTYMLDSNSVKF